MNTDLFLLTSAHYYELALEETAGGWFDGACWHFASASYDVLRMTGHDVALCHISRNTNSPDHAVVRLTHDSGEILFLDADGLQTADQLIEKMKIEGGFTGDWYIIEDNQWNTPEISQSNLTETLRNAFFTKISPTYYHVTLPDNIPSILERGIEPRIGENSSDCGERIPAVFCFPSRQYCDEALGQWMGELFDEEEELVILEIKPTALPDRSDVPFEVAFERVISAEEIVCAYSEDWVIIQEIDPLSALLLTNSEHPSTPSQGLTQ